MLPLREINRRIVLGVYARTGKDKTQTAARLGVSLKTVYNHLARYGVRPRQAHAGRAARDAFHDTVITEETTCE